MQSLRPPWTVCHGAYVILQRKAATCKQSRRLIRQIEPVKAILLQSGHGRDMNSLDRVLPFGFGLSIRFAVRRAVRPGIALGRVALERAAVG